MATHDASESSTAKAGQAPAPDDSRKPESPKDLVKPNWKYIAKKTLREFSKDQCPARADFSNMIGFRRKSSRIARRSCSCAFLSVASSLADSVTPFCFEIGP